MKRKRIYNKILYVRVQSAQFAWVKKTARRLKISRSALIDGVLQQAR